MKQGLLGIEHFVIVGQAMRESLRKKIIQVCSKKIEVKDSDVGVSFYAFFENRNSDPELLMEAAEWWILTNKLDHFEKATKIRSMVEASLGNQ
jgi:Family of unknown function (DUF6500)